jgi:hypothetical protein
MTTPINYCKCGKPANKLVIYKGHEFVLCAKHIEQLEQFLGKKAKPLPRNYEARQQNLSGLFLTRDADYYLLLDDIENSSEETSDKEYLAEEVAL